MTVPLHMFMKELLVGAEFDHHTQHHHHHHRNQQPHKHRRSSNSSTNSSSSEDSIRLVVDNARSHPLPTKKRNSSPRNSLQQLHNRQHTMKDVGIDMKKIQQGRYRQRLMMDISDHSKRESRWGGVDKKVVSFSASTDFHNKQQHKSLDVSDHSKKDTRWNSSRLTLEETLSRAIMNHPQRKKSTDKPPPAKVLDVSDHSRRESRWDSIEPHQERLQSDCHSMSPIKDLQSRRRAGRAVRSGRSRSNDSLDTMKFLSEWRQQQQSQVNHHQSEVGNSSAPTIMMDDDNDDNIEDADSSSMKDDDARKKRRHQANTRLALEQVEQAIELVSAALREQSLK